MKKILPVALFSVLIFVIYNSKTEDYKEKKEFYNSNFSSEIIKIETTRGTKIQCKDGNYFYESDYEGVKLMEGDIIRKNNESIIVLRKNPQDEYTEIGTGKSIKPESSYFNYFFGL